MISATVVMLCLSLLMGILIAVLSRYFEAVKDPRQDKVLALLPAYNCGNCGFPGCAQYAAAVVAGKAPANKCSPGGIEVASKIRSVLGKDYD